MIKLRDFQQQALEAETRHRADHPDETRLAVVLPTGTGKTVLFAERAKRFAEDEHDRLLRAFDVGVIVHGGRKRVLVLVHTDELAGQAEATVRYVCAESEFPISVGVVKADRDEVTADIIIASRQTLERPERRARIADVGLVIVDECHIGITAYEPILRHFGCFAGNNPCSIHTGWASAEGEWLDCTPGCLGNLPHTRATPALGFTATLERSDGAGLGGIWQNVVFTRDISWAVRKGYLVQPVGYQLEIDLSESMVTEHGQFANTDRGLDAQLVEGIAPERIVEKWQELAADRQTIVFAPLVRSAGAIAKAFRDIADVDAEVVYGDMPDQLRRLTIAAFKAGQIQVLVNAMVLTAGFDHPGIGCVIVARPTKSRTLFVQMAGRGLRPVPGTPVEEQDCILITLADTTSDLCSVADLSERPIDRKADGPLTVMEDEWDIGRDLEDAARHWTGRVDATRFDPIVATRSKVWARTQGGTWFVPISKDREYVFLSERPGGDTDIYVLTRPPTGFSAARTIRAERITSAPDLELAFQAAEDIAAERGGDVGALLADRTRAWRKGVPGDKMLDYANRLGLNGEVNRILSARAGGKAGRVSDLIRRVEASRSIDPMMEKIKEGWQA